MILRCENWRFGWAMCAGRSEQQWGHVLDRQTWP